MNEPEYFIFIPVKRFIASLAKIERFALVIILIAAIIELGLIYAFSRPEGVLFGMLSDQLLSILTALLSITALWCHHTLLGGRGLAFTRFLCAFSTVLGAISFICSIYTVCAGELLMAKQAQAPIFIATVLFIASLMNLPNMAAASLKHKILIPLFFFALMGALPTTVLPEVCLLFKILLFCTGFPLLRTLEQIAPLIISMPEQN